MTDTKAPSPWFEVIKGLLPSLNTSITAIVTLAVGVAGTIATQRLTTPPPPAPRVVEVVKTVPDAGSTLQRLSVIEGKLDQMLADQAARKGKKTVTAKAK